VLKLDLEEKKAFVRSVDAEYYTDAEQAVKIRVLEVEESRDGRSHGEVEVTYLPTIYKKIRLQTHENVGWGTIHLDEDPFPTTAYWISLPDHIAGSMPRQELETGLRSVGHVLGQVAPLFLMCDPQDIAVWPEMKGTFARAPTIYVYDRIAGGIGFSKRLFGMHQQLLARAGDLVARCPCDQGCPSCIGPREEHGPDPKLCALSLLGVLLSEIRLPARRQGA
jgi:DEAD/DEAH box helicase domain-containing protein